MRFKLLRRSKVSRHATFIRGRGKISYGRDCVINSYAVLDAQHGVIEIGDRTSINSFTILYGKAGIYIGNECHIASHVSIVSADHNYLSKATIRSQGYANKGVRIGNDVWIGSGARVLPGAVIPDGCVIGANSVVKGELEPYGVYVGSPARLIKTRQ